MTKYDYPEHYEESVLSAIKLAEQLKDSGEYDLFRGQRCTFPIQPTADRPGVDKLSVNVELNDFASWVHETPDLESLHDNENSILAVAQHYGLKTHLLDFSRSPRIAGFFATDGAEDGDTGTIICVNKKRFIESWSDINKKYHDDEGLFLTEIIDVDVNNLWRLQAQEGEFLRCHVDPNLLEMFSCFLHIYFPQDSRISIISKENIYPPEKSHLEVLLDQYFLINSYPERNTQLENFFGTTISISEESIKKEIEAFFKNNELPEIHESWGTSSAMLWLQEPNEHYHEHEVLTDIQLIFPKLNNPHDLEVAIEKQLRNVFANIESNKRPSVKWNVFDEKGNVLYVDQEGITKNANGDFTEFAVAEMVNSIYQGMRYLPYKNAEIIRVIVRYFMMLSFGVYQIIDDCEGVEFSGGSVRGRGFASNKRIRDALREDFFEMIKSTKLDASSKLDFRDTLFSASFVKSAYKFDSFLKVFVEDLIPSQAVIAVEGLVIGVNPMRIDVFGES